MVLVRKEWDKNFDPEQFSAEEYVNEALLSEK